MVAAPERRESDRPIPLRIRVWLRGLYTSVLTPVERATALARHPRIRVSDLEVRLATRFTVDTLAALRRLHPNVAFVWMMGADNLVQLPEWQGWLEIVGSVPVAVFARPTYSLRALAGKGHGEYRCEHCRSAQYRAGTGSADASDGLVTEGPSAQKVHRSQQ